MSITPGEPGGVRIGDRERERAISALGDHMAAGRLTMEEYQHRLDLAGHARTDADLAPLFSDLPAAAPAVVKAPPPRRDSGLERLVAASGGLALIAFFVCGFALHGWAWSWIFFLVPGVLRTLAHGDRHR